MSNLQQNVKREIQLCEDHLNIEFTNLCYYPPGNKVKESTQKPILKNICGKFVSGRLTAIIGPSGAGKTSLLNVLSGFKINGASGSVKINGKERNFKQFRKQSCYITQEFAMLELLMTKETLHIAADLKLDSNVGKQKKNEMVNEIMHILGLEKVADTSVGKLSGGEKKRLSIGLELLTNPPVMFFDEPTSGLDSSSALQVISHLRSLALGGRTVVCSIHQPSSRLFENFDDLFLMAYGQCIYNGPAHDLTSLIGEAGFHCPNFYNRADFAIEVANGERGNNTDMLIAKFNYIERGSLNHQQDVSIEEISLLNPTTLKENETSVQICTENEVYAEATYPQSTWNQFQVLFKRSLLCSLRDKLSVQFRIIVHLVVGLLLGFVYYDIGNDASKTLSNVSCIFFFILFLFFSNAMPSVVAIPQETSVMLHEHLNNWYSLRAYFFSKIAADIPLQVLCPTIFLLMGYFLSSQPYDGARFLQFWFICLLLTTVGHNIGLATGASFRNPQVGLFVVPALNIPLVLFSGFFITLQDVPKWAIWLTYISYYRYAFEGAMQCVYGYDRPNLECSEPYCYFKSPLKFLEQFHMADSVFQYDVLALVIWAVIIQIILFFALKLRIHNSQ